MERPNLPTTPEGWLAEIERLETENGKLIAALTGCHSQNVLRKQKLMELTYIDGSNYCYFCHRHSPEHRSECFVGKALED